MKRRRIVIQQLANKEGVTFLAFPEEELKFVRAGGRPLLNGLGSTPQEAVGELVYFNAQSLGLEIIVDEPEKC